MKTEPYFKSYSHQYIYISHNDYFYCLLSSVILWFTCVHMEAQWCIPLHDCALLRQQCDDRNPNYIWPPVSYWVKNSVCSASNHSIQSQRQIRKDIATLHADFGTVRVGQTMLEGRLLQKHANTKTALQKNTYLWMKFRPLSTKLINQVMSCNC